MSDSLRGVSAASPPENFRSDLTAPHAPLPIGFTADLVALDAAAQRGWPDNPAVVAAYQDFLAGAVEFISPAAGPTG